MLDPSIFRAYDIRGVAGVSLTEESVSLIGKALGSLVRSLGDNQITVARDGRLSGPVLFQALSEGIRSTGCDVINLGIVPTPLLYYAAYLFDQHSGVMLTGSHNPPDYNGLKMVVQGKTLSEEGITALYQRIQANEFEKGDGDEYELDITERYIQHVCRNIHLARPLKIVIDAGNGVAGKIAPDLFRRLNCEVHELFCDVDGRFPNHHPDPSQTENLRDLIRVVQAEKADIGLAFDGDGDRLGVVTSEGEVIWPDRLLMLFAKALLAERPNAKIIYDVKCTNQLAGLIREHHGEPLMWKTGHSLIKAKLAETKAQLAGEMSGHFFFKDRWFGFDDALYAGARCLEIISKQDKKSGDLFATIPNSVNTPELKVAVSDEKKFHLMQKLIDQADFKEAEEIVKIDGLRVNFSNGWGLVRPSNTTPCLVLRFEAADEAKLLVIQNLFRVWMLSVEPQLELPF